LHQLGEVFHDFLQGWQGWLAQMLDGNQGRKLVNSEQFYSIPGINNWQRTMGYSEQAVAPILTHRIGKGPPVFLVVPRFGKKLSSAGRVTCLDV
jgi:hypothetical protein